MLNRNTGCEQLLFIWDPGKNIIRINQVTNYIENLISVYLSPIISLLGIQFKNCYPLL